MNSPYLISGAFPTTDENTVIQSPQVTLGFALGIEHYGLGQMYTGVPILVPYSFHCLKNPLCPIHSFLPLQTPWQELIVFALSRVLFCFVFLFQDVIFLELYRM
jgi:hypothetical protein